MATTKRETSTSMKEKRGTSPSSSKPSPKKPSCSSPSSSTASCSTEKQVPNYLKPTKSSCSETALKNLKKPAIEDPNNLRRRSFDRPPSAARAHKALISPVRHKSASPSSLSSKSTTATLKAPSEKVAKTPNVAAKPHTLASSRKTPITTTTRIKRGTSTPPSSLKKPPSIPDRREARSVETKHKNKENLDHQVEPEEVVKDNDQGEVDDTKIPNAEESEEVVKDDDQGKEDDTKIPNVEESEEVVKDDQGEAYESKIPKVEESEEVVKDNQDEVDDTKVPKAEESGNTDAIAEDVDATQVTNVVDDGEQDTLNISTVVSEQHNDPEPELESKPEVEPESEPEKVEEDKVEEGKSDHIQHDEDKENQGLEETVVVDDSQQENTHEDPDATTETEHGEEDHTTEDVAASATKETEEEQEKQPESRQEDDDEGSRQEGLESSLNEMVQELEVKSEAEVEIELTKEPEPEPKAEPESKVEPELEPKVEAEPTKEPELEPKTELESNVEAEPKAANVVAKNQVQGKKESKTPYNDVIEETASKLLTGKRKNKVLALVGAFETVIDKETPDTPNTPNSK